MAVESFELIEVIRIGEVAIDDTDRIVLVHRSDNSVACVLDGSHVARCDVTGRANQCESIRLHLG